MMWLVTLAVLMLAAAAWLMWLARQGWQRSGLPGGEIIYVDTGDWRRSNRSLFSVRYQLAGKPDYLVKMEGKVIPVEVKKSHLDGSVPYPSHVHQLAAYCLLVEDVLGARPPYGILHYANTTLKIPYTDALRATLLQTLSDIQLAHKSSNLKRQHDDPARCRHCGFRHACGSQALA